MRKFVFALMLVILAISLTPLTAQEGQTYYINTSSARIRSCPRTNCEIITRLRSGTAFVIDDVVDGARVSGSTDWYEITVNGRTGYVHASLTTSTPPAPPPSSSSSSSSSSSQNSSVPAGVRASGGCPGLSYTCSQLTCDQARACLAAGGGDLDRDNDGKPCETQCGG